MSKIKLRLSKDFKYNSIITLSNDIVNAKYHFSLPTQKFLFFLISKIEYEEKNSGKFLKEYVHTFSEILSFFKETGRENDKNLKGLLKNVFKEIKENEILISRINQYGKEYYKSYPWYSSIEFDEEIDVFKFKFNQEISELLINLKKSFFQSHLKEYMRIKSSHAINLYLILRAEEYTNSKRKYPLESLKEKLGVKENKSYERWISFSNRVLKNSLDQLNKNTNYIFSFDIERIGRRVGFVIFQVFNKKHVKALSNYIASKMEIHFNKQQNHIKALFESQKLNQLLYYYDPIKDHLTLSLENTYIQSKEQIEPLQSLFSEIDVHKKVLSNIFRKGTTLSFELSVTPWEQFIGETKNVFDRLIEKCQLSHKQAYAVIMKYELSEIREKIKEKLMFHQKGVLKKYEWDKGVINPIQNVPGYIYSQVFEMKMETNL